MGSAPAVVWDPRSEPVFHDLMACCTRSSSHTVAACCGCTNIPRPVGGAQEAGTILSVGCCGQRPIRFCQMDPERIITSFRMGPNRTHRRLTHVPFVDRYATR